MLQIYRYELDYIKSNMYVALEEEEALIIDPVISEAAKHLLQDSNVQKILFLLTHEHFDHTVGINYLKHPYQTKLICQRNCAESICVAKNNRPLSLLLIKSSDNGERIRSFYDSIELYTHTADIVFDKQYAFSWRGHSIQMRSTPGHSKGSCCIELDRQYVFTGDSLIPNIAVITRYPGGSAEEYQEMTLPYLQSIPAQRYVMPGHGMPCRMCELEYRNGCFMNVGSGEK